jgi:hypothetical protein
MSVELYQTTWRHMPEDCKLYSHGDDKVKYHENTSPSLPVGYSNLRGRPILYGYLILEYTVCSFRCCSEHRSCRWISRGMQVVLCDKAALLSAAIKGRPCNFTRRPTTLPRMDEETEILYS